MLPRINTKSNQHVVSRPSEERPRLYSILLGNQQVAFQMALRVQHCKKAMEFFINFSSGSRALLHYQELPGRVLDFDHTETPADQQGKGIAKILVTGTTPMKSFQEGLKYAAENNYKIKPTCPYVAKYVNEKGTPDEKKLVVH
ncbi:hypothetical protein COOONC_26984 [Cooperia oncophora]